MRNGILIGLLLLGQGVCAQDWMANTEMGTLAFGFDFDETSDGFIAIGTDTVDPGYGYQTIITAKFSQCGDLIWEQYIDPP